MVKIRPSIDEEELNDKLRHACPRIKRWKTRIDDADGDVHRMREQAITKSPVYVAIQRGSKNILIRTKTNPKWWRKWIQDGKKYGIDQAFATPIHIPSEAYRYQKQISLSKKSPQKSPRRSIPVSPVKSRLHSPVKVSYIKNEDQPQTPKRVYAQKGVPMLTLTPVPLNQVLKRKARMVGNISATFGKGRWIEQDSSLLAVPGKEVYQYDSSSETEDESQRKGGEILDKLLHPHSPERALHRLASAKRRESPMHSPKKSPKKAGDVDLEDESASEGLSDESSPSGTTQRVKRKIRAVGQTSLYFTPNRKLNDEDVVEESEEDGRVRSGRDKSATIRKIRAAGAVKSALSPHKSPSKSPGSSPRTPGSIKRKIRATGMISAFFSPKRGESDEPVVDEFGNIISPERDGSQKTTPSSLGSFFRKIKTITRLSSTSKPDASPSSIGSLMTKMRFITRISPRRKTAKETDETKEGEAEAEAEEEEKDEEEDEEDEERVSCLRKCCRCFCPCIGRKKDEDLMEYQSGSQAEM